MMTTKRLLLVSDVDADSQPDAVSQRLTECGFNVTRTRSGDTGLARAARDADAIVLEFDRDDVETHFDPTPLTEALHRALRMFKRPVIALAEEPDRSPVIDGIDEVLSLPLDPVHLKARINALQRLATMREEMARRQATALDYGLELADPSKREAEREAGILIIGTGPSFGRLEAQMDAVGTVFGALSGATALDYLLYRRFDVVIMEMPVCDAEDFLASLRRNARFHDLPVIILGEMVAHDEAAGLFSAGVTDIVSFEGHEEGFVARAKTLIAEHRALENLRDSYREARHVLTSDALTGLFSRGFLLDHLSRVIADTERNNHPLAVAAFSIDNIGAINADLGYPAGDRIIRQLSDIVIGMIRGEDLAARWSGGIFVLVFPATSLEEADAAAHRLSAVLEASSFSLNGFEQTISVIIRTAVNAFKPGDTAEALVRRTAETAHGV